MNRRSLILGLVALPMVLSLSSCRSSGRSDKLVVVPRSQWAPLGSMPPAKSTPMGSISRITVHHDGIEPITPLETYDQIQSRLQTIRKYHLARGWADIGYHYIIDPRGRVWMGRPLQLQGAHVSGGNDGNIGILLLGNFQFEQPSDEALESLSILIGKLQKKYRIPAGRIYGHCELAVGTECPGHHLKDKMGAIRRKAR